MKEKMASAGAVMLGILIIASFLKLYMFS